MDQIKGEGWIFATKLGHKQFKASQKYTILIIYNIIHQDSTVY